MKGITVPSRLMIGAEWPPNEKVYNVSNDDANPTNSRFPDVGYGYIDTETRDIGFSPEDNTWAFNLNMNEK